MLVCIMCGVVANVNCSPFRSEKIAVTTAPPPSVIGGLLRMYVCMYVCMYACVCGRVRWGTEGCGPSRSVAEAIEEGSVMQSC